MQINHLNKAEHWFKISEQNQNFSQVISKNNFVHKKNTGSHMLIAQLLTTKKTRFKISPEKCHHHLYKSFLWKNYQSAIQSIELTFWCHSDLISIIFKFCFVVYNSSILILVWNLCYFLLFLPSRLDLVTIAWIFIPWI